MNDFSELEAELKKLRPAQPSAGLVARIEEALSESGAEDKIIRPERFRVNWVSVGFGLAAAALLLVFARVHIERRQHPAQAIARSSPVPVTTGDLSSLGRENEATPLTNQFIPANATRRGLAVCGRFRATAAAHALSNAPDVAME
jgi:hypothetical protein